MIPSAAGSTTGYEFAPSTVMLAQSCACCGRALRDAISVERGVGPDCAAKYGYGEKQAEPDWAAALAFLGGIAGMKALGIESALWVSALGEDARVAANVLVHRAACADMGAERVRFGAAIVALGFIKLGAAVAKAASDVTVTVERTGGFYIVKAPYDESLSPAFRTAQIGAYFDRPSKTWRIPIGQRERVALFDILSHVYVGATIVGPLGVRKLGGGQ